MIVGNVVNINNNTDNYSFLNNLNNSCCAPISQLSYEVFEGNGNIFAIIDERIYIITNDEMRSRLGREICNINPRSAANQNNSTNQGNCVRIDGVLFLQPSNIADIKMRIFEKDGTE